MSRPATLSERHEAAYQFILAYKAEHDGNSPSMRQVGAAIGVESSSLMDYYLTGLEKAGLIIRPTNEARGIIVVGGQWVPPKGAQP